jgi:hypothetical protein
LTHPPRILVLYGCWAKFQTVGTANAIRWHKPIIWRE